MDETTSIAALQDAFLENNEAAAHLIVGQDMDSAIRLLTNALRSCQYCVDSANECDEARPQNPGSEKEVLVKLLDRCMTAPSARQPDHDDNNAALPSPTSPAVACSRIISRQHGRIIKKHQEGASRRQHSSESIDSDREAHLYVRPIFVPPCYFGSHKGLIKRLGITDTCTFLACVVTFNLALAYQLSAQDLLSGGSIASSEPVTCSQERQDQYQQHVMRKAARLYEVCRAFLVEHDFGDHQGSYPDPSLFDLASANNLGVALSVLDQDCPQSKECFKDVMSALMLLTDQNTRVRTYERKHQPLTEDIEGFFRNAYSVLDNVGIAPAA